MRSLNYKQNFLAMIIFYVMVLGNIAFADDTRTLSVSEMIKESYKKSDIDKNDYLIQTLRSYFDPSSVDISFKDKGLGNKPTREITVLLSQAMKIYDDLNERDKKFLDALLKRPTDINHTVSFVGGAFYLPAPVKVFEPTVADYPNIGGKFKFWYVDHNKTDASGTNHQTTLSAVKKMADEFENVYQEEIVDMEYPVPPSDTGSTDEGNDTKFDIYSMNVGSKSIYGYASHTKPSSGNSAYSFMVMDNDFTEFSPITATEAMQVTAAHEYHHVVQNGINAFSDSWYKEATSTWMEEKVYDEVNDNRQYISHVMNSPEISLDTAGNHWYGTWIFNEYLSTRWDNDTVKDIWTQLDPEGSDNALDAIEHVVETKGETLKDLYRDFWAKNYQKNNFYDEGNHWPSVKIENDASVHTMGGYTTTTPISFIDSIPEQSLTLDNMSAKLYKFKADSSLVDKKTLVVQVSADVKDEITAIAIVKNIDGSYKEYPIDLDASGKGEIGIAGFSGLTTDEVILAIVNYSKTKDSIAVTYSAFLAKPITFVIDDTGSMGGEIAAAKIAANTVLNTNKASGKHYFYTLLSYKDGPATLDGQSSDEDVMKGYIDALYAYGGAGCPESAFLSIRQATELAENSDIYIMTDADSNSYGVDNTYASWGELWETVFAVLNTNSHVHAIVYSDCGYHGDYKNIDGIVDDSTQEDSCSEDEFLARTSFKEYASGIDGYTKTSSETGGLYFKATASTTEDITKIILNHSSADSTVVHIDANDTSKTYTLPIDESIEKFEVVINTSSGVTATVKLKNPSGRVVSESDTDVSVINVSGNTFYLISDSAVSTGDWSVEVNATGNYTFASKGFTDNALTYMGDTSVGIGGELSVKASIEKDITGLKFYLLNVVDGTLKELTLSNTSGLIYEGTMTMTEGGSYRFLVQGDGSFQRMYPSKIVVNKVNLVAPSSKNVNKGDNLTYTFTVENKSSVEATYNLYATSSQGWANLTTLPTSITLPAEGTKDISIDVNVSATATSGEKDILSMQVVDSTNVLVRSAKSVETRIATLYDLDEDGDVDVTDIMMVASQWGKAQGDDGYSLTLDLDDDNRIGIKDIMIVAAQWGWSI